jgi:hypothetical protein
MRIERERKQRRDGKALPKASSGEPRIVTVSDTFPELSVTFSMRSVESTHPTQIDPLKKRREQISTLARSTSIRLALREQSLMPVQVKIFFWRAKLLI